MGVEEKETSPECVTIKQNACSGIAMEPATLSTEVILAHPRQSLGSVQLDWMPQPGSYLDLGGRTYAVLERRHRYQLKAGRYRLHKISLFVQSAPRPSEKTWVDGRWVLGDAACQFNAHSELIRCAVNPEGPCAACRYFEKVSPAIAEDPDC
jgi:hypothetical protein